MKPSPQERLQQVQASAAERETEEQRVEAEQQEQERVAEMKKVKGIFDDRNALKEAVEQVSASRTAFEEKRAARREILGKNGAAIEELKELDEAAAAEVNITDGEEFGRATTDAAEAVSDLRKQKEMLRELGVDANGKSLDEIVEAINSRRTELDTELEDYARNRPELDSPELELVRQELIQREIDEIGTHMPESSYDNIMNGAADRAGNRGLKLEGHKLANRVSSDNASRSFTHSLIYAAKESKTTEHLVAVVAERTTADELSKQSVLEALKRQLLNYKEDESGEISHRDEISSYETTGRGGMKRGVDFLAAIAEAQGRELPMYEDRSGLTAEAGPVLAEALDEDQLEDFANKIVEAAAIEKELAALPTKERQLLEAESLLKEKTTELDRLKQEDTEGDRHSIEEKITEIDQGFRELELLINNDPILSESSIGSESRRYATIEISHYSEELAKIDEETRTLRGAFEQVLLDAKKAYDDAKKVKRNFLNRGKHDLAEKDAKNARDKAQTAVDNFGENQKYKDLRQEREEVFGELKEKRGRIKDALSKVGVSSSDTVPSGTSENFLEYVSGKAENRTKKLESQLGRINTRQAEVEGSKAQLEKETEALQEQLSIVSENYRNVAEYMKQEHERLERKKARAQSQLKNN